MINTMLLSLAAGILISSISRDEKRARGATVLLLLFLAGGLPLAGALLEYEFKVRGTLQWFVLLSPGYAFSAAWGRPGPAVLPGFWQSMAAIQILTWLFLLGACYLTPRTWRDRPVRSQKRLARWFQRGSAVRNDGSSGRLRTRLLEINPFLWLSSRPLHKSILVWAVLLAVTLVWLGFGIKYPRDLFHHTMFVVMGLTWNSILKVWVASEATRQIALDRKSGAIELLLSTPLTVTDIARGLRLSLMRQFGVPVLVVLGAETILLVWGVGRIHATDAQVAWVTVWLFGMAMLPADLWALYAVGLWQSAVAKAPAQAAGGSAFRILALPWLLYMGLAAMVAMAEALGILRMLPNAGWFFWLASWGVIGFGVDALYGWRSWRAVQSQFREAASRQRPEGAWGASLGRFYGRMKAGRRPAL
jgi:hypothetical protein